MTRLEKRRRELGLTQMQAANAAGITQSLLSRFESGVREPRLQAALRIAKALGTTVEALFGGEGTDESA